MKQLWTLLFLSAAGGAACGEVTPGEPADAAPDAPPAPVKLTVLNYQGDGLPDTAAQMVFNDPEGNVVFEGPVDASGKLEAPLPRGGTITEVRIVVDTPTQLRAEITSIIGVKPGDDLTFGFKKAPVVTNQGGQTSMAANFTPVAGASTHSFFTTCGTSSVGTTSPVTLNFRDSCHGPTFDLLAIATGGSLTAPRFVRLTNINHENGQSFTIPGGFAAMSNFTVNGLNVPEGTAAFTAARSSMLGDRAVGPQLFGSMNPTAGTVTATVPFPPGVGTRSEVTLSISRTDAVGSQDHAVHTATLGTSVDIDLALQKVPWFTNLFTTTTGATWETVVPGDADGQLTLWTGTWTDGTRQVTVGWRIAHAPSGTGMTLPRLSAKHAAVDPQAQTVPVTPTSGIEFAVDLDLVDGYDAFRQSPDTFLIPTFSSMGAFVGMPVQRRLYQAPLLPGAMGPVTDLALKAPTSTHPFGAD